MERFNLKKLNEVEGKEQYPVEISNRFAAWENLDTEVDINKGWETIRENIKISAMKSLGYKTEETQAMAWWRMLKIIRPKKISEIAMVAGSMGNKWG